MANRHYLAGRHYLFSDFDRILAMYHFGQVVRYLPVYGKAWYFYMLSMFVPRVLIRKRKAQKGEDPFHT